MSKRYDSVVKDLLERDPGGWVRLAFGPVVGRATLVDSDISTVSGAADKVVFLKRKDPVVIHFEAFASWDPTLLVRAVNYNAAHHRRHRVPVHTVLVVLRPKADHRLLTGVYESISPINGKRLRLEYDVLRIWTLDLETVLRGPLATLPLASITDAAAERLPQVLAEMDARLHAEATPEERKDLLTDAYVLTGLRQPPGKALQLFRGIPGMKESSTYQAILEEGRQKGHQAGVVEEAARSLLIVGVHRFGEPDAAARRRIESERSVARVEMWLDNLLLVESWAELLALTM